MRTQQVSEDRAVRTLDAAPPARVDRVPLSDAGQLRDAWQDALESVEVLSRQARGLFARLITERPTVVLACATGLGFVLGGGLASRTGALLARAGSRVVLAHLLQRWLEGGDLTLHPTTAAASASLE